MGMGAVAMMNEMIPHEHFSSGREGPEAVSLRRVWLFIIAITIHNAPEGLAVGVAFRLMVLQADFPSLSGSDCRMRLKGWLLQSPYWASDTRRAAPLALRH